MAEDEAMIIKDLEEQDIYESVGPCTKSKVEENQDHYHLESLIQSSNDTSISMDYSEDALVRMQPSAIREGFTTRPNVSWDKVGSLEKVREEMRSWPSLNQFIDSNYSPLLV